MKTNLLKYALLALPLSLFATGCSTGEEPGASLSSRNSIEVRFELPVADIALRKMHMRAIEETGLTCADEMLYPKTAAI